MPLKQVIVARKDLGMRKGKMMAQAGHAVLQAFLGEPQYDPATQTLTAKVSPEGWAWWCEYQTKIALGVADEAELLAIFAQVQARGLPVALITDAGLTEFQGVPTRTALAIGPADAATIDFITGHLSLL